MPSQSRRKRDSSPRGGAIGKPGHSELTAGSPTKRKRAGPAYGGSSF